MTGGPLDAFLSAPPEGASAAGVDATERWLQSVLGQVIDGQESDEVREVTGEDAETLDALVAVATSDRGEPVPGLLVDDAAAILATASPFSRAEIRGRLRDQLLLAMSREPTDLAALCDRYGFGDPDPLRAAIEGEAALDLRTYARLRVALGQNHNP